MAGAAGQAAGGLAKWAGELAKGVYGYWQKGRWTPLAITARHRARLRKETLLAGGLATATLVYHLAPCADFIALAPLV